MRSIFYLTLGAMASLAAAASMANPFNIPPSGYSFKAGEPTTLTWNPTTSGPVTLRLQSGAVMTPSSGVPIAQSIANSGSFTWTPPANIADKSDYTVEIISDTDNGAVNYLPRFAVEGATGSVSTKSAASTTSATTTSASTTSASSSSSSSSASSSTEKTTSTSSTSTPKSRTTLATTMTSPSSTPTPETSASSTAASSSANVSSSASASMPVPPSSAGTVNRVPGVMIALVLGVIAVY